jgi:hypothetical protein
MSPTFLHHLIPFPFPHSVHCSAALSLRHLPLAAEFTVNCSFSRAKPCVTAQASPSTVYISACLSLLHRHRRLVTPSATYFPGTECREFLLTFSAEPSIHLVVDFRPTSVLTDWSYVGHILLTVFFNLSNFLSSLQFFYLVCEAIGTAATPGLLSQPRVIVKMIVEQEMEYRLAGETEVLGEYLPPRHFCPSQKSHMIRPGFEPGLPRLEAGD